MSPIGRAQPPPRNCRCAFVERLAAATTTTFAAWQSAGALGLLLLCHVHNRALLLLLLCRLSLLLLLRLLLLLLGRYSLLVPGFLFGGKILLCSRLALRQRRLLTQHLEHRLFGDCTREG